MMRYFVSLVFIMSIFNNLVLAENKNDVYKLDKLNNQIINLKKSLVGDGDSQESLNNQLRKTELALGKISARVGVLEKKIKILNQKVSNLNKQKKILIAYLDEHKSLVKNHIGSIYTQGDDEPIKLILNQQDPKKINRIFEYYTYFINARNKKINSFTSKIKELDVIQEDISNKKSNLVNDQNELKNKKINFLSLQNKRGLTVKKLNKKINSSQMKLALYAKQKANLELLLMKSKKELQNFEGYFSKNNFSENKGKLPWPVNGNLINQYSLKSNSSLHSRGWLFNAMVGSAVKVVHDGKIVFADYLKGHGLLIIVNHGNGYMTLYAHNQFLLKKWVIGF